MNPAKSKVKAGVYEELGREYEEREEAAKGEVQQQIGAKDGLKHAAGKIGELGEFISKEIDDGTIAGLSGDPLKIAAYAMKWVKRSVGVCDNLATMAEIGSHKATGKVKGLADAKSHAFKLWEAEVAQLAAYAKALEEGKLEEYDDGHPGPSLKAQRSEGGEEKPKGPSKPNPLADRGPGPNPMARPGKKADRAKKAQDKATGKKSPSKKKPAKKKKE